MCQQIFVTYTSCSHTRPHPAGPLRICSTASARFWSLPCRKLYPEHEEAAGHCRKCLIDLSTRLAIIAKKQEMGKWEWTLKVVPTVEE